MKLCSRAALVAAACAAALAAQTSSLLNMDEFVQDWKQSRQFTLEVAAAMPAEFYTFKLDAGQMSFGEQLLHIAAANSFRFAQITGIKPPLERRPPESTAADKAAVMKLLGESFDYVIAVLPKITPQQLERTWHIPDWKGRTDPDARAMMLNMFVHTAHHRAQCEVYLRAKHITPPVYTF